MAVALRAVAALTAPATGGRSSRVLCYEVAAISRLRAVDPRTRTVSSATLFAIIWAYLAHQHTSDITTPRSACRKFMSPPSKCPIVRRAGPPRQSTMVRGKLRRRSSRFVGATLVHASEARPERFTYHARQVRESRTAPRALLQSVSLRVGPRLKVLGTGGLVLASLAPLVLQVGLINYRVGRRFCA